MTRKVYVVTDLGPGDGGKGGVVHKIASMLKAFLIIKVGGAQGSHGVRTSRGESFAFSQWGCGTFEGIPTHLSPRFIVSIEGLLNEAEALRYGHGVHDPFSLLTVDHLALCSIPYHGISSRLKELARGKNPRGTIGTGVGEAFRYAQSHPELSLRVNDLARPDMREFLAAVRDQITHDLEPVIQSGFFEEDDPFVEENVQKLFDDEFLDFITARAYALARNLQVVDRDYLRQMFLRTNRPAVVESSHGVLTDHYCGFEPHTSAIRTLPMFAHSMLRDADFDGQIVNIGVHRAYEIRHGAGPMPTADDAMGETLLPGSHKEENRWQGKVRVGPLDLVLMRYAIACCGGPKAFDGLAITWFDQVHENGDWQICDHYKNAKDREFFTPDGELKVSVGDNIERLIYQEGLGQQLQGCIPEISSIPVPLNANRDELFELCARVLQERLSVPVRMVSLGPTETDKVCK